MPTPPPGGFILIMRLYGPKQAVTVGRWDPSKWQWV